jgi:hypothetical protein
MIDHRGFPVHRGSRSIRIGEAEAVIPGLGMQALIKAGIELKVADPQIGGLHQAHRGLQFGRTKLGRVNLPAELQA